MHLRQLSFHVTAGLLICCLIQCSGGAPKGTARKGGASAPIPVAVADVTRQPIELRRSFSGSLEAPARFVVAPKVGGRLARLTVNLADEVHNGQVVAELDDAEFQQAVNQALAEVAVAEANQTEARSNLEIAGRDLQRMTSLRAHGVATDAQVDAVKATHLAREAGVEVAAAQVTRAHAALAAARVRLGYTAVTAQWSGEGPRYVAARHVDEGATFSANTPLLTVVALDPMVAVVYVTEKDYGLLRVGQSASLISDAFPGRRFAGRVARVAPVFDRDSRQARIELELPNPDHLLKPGLFVHAEVLLDQAADAATVPVTALVDRGGETGVFLVDEAGESVRWHSLQPGIRGRERVQVPDDVSGRVVTMGHQMLQDGARITVPANAVRPETLVE